jgi:hypothetical protein
MGVIGKPAEIVGDFGPLPERRDQLAGATDQRLARGRVLVYRCHGRRHFPSQQSLTTRGGGDVFMDLRDRGIDITKLPKSRHRNDRVSV